MDRTLVCSIGSDDFIRKDPGSLSPFFDLASYVESEKEQSDNIFANAESPKAKDVLSVQKNWDDGDDIYFLVSGDWLRSWIKYLFEDGDFPGTIDNSKLIYSCSQGDTQLTVILEPGLLQGIDYYIVNRPVWNFLDKQYGSQYPLFLRRISQSVYHDLSPSKAPNQSNDEVVQKDSSCTCKYVVPNIPSFPSQLPDHFQNYHQSTLSSVYACEVCGEDAILCCSRCKRCFYCSLTCRNIHIPYHRYNCEQVQVTDMTPMLSPTTQEPSLIRQGIFNTGNTCYLASALQCLFSVTPLRSLLMGKQYERYLRSDSRNLSDALSDVFISMKFGKISASARLVRSALLRNHPELSLWNQEDSHEAIEKILDSLQDEWNVVSSHPRGFPSSIQSDWTAFSHTYLSPISPIFSFLLRTESTCSSCHASSSTFQSATSISLPIPVGHQLQLSIILYHPIFIDTSLIVAPKPRQLALLVHQSTTLRQLQRLVALADLMHAKERNYVFRAASGQAATADWVEGRLTEGRNLVCRLQQDDSITAGMSNIRWLELEVLQDGKLKKLQRSVVLGLDGLTATILLDQLNELYSGIDHVTFRNSNGKTVDLKEGNELVSSLLPSDATTLSITIQSGVRHVTQKTSVTSMTSTSSSRTESFFITTLIALASNSRETSSLYVDPLIAQEAKEGKSGLFLDSCLQSFFRREILDYSADYTCEKCGKVVELIRDQRLVHCPQVLILHLMRFAFDVNGAVKIYENVDYPLHGLDLSVYFGCEKNTIVYDLIGVINHIGTIHGGHYISYINCSAHPENEDEFDWMCFNDTYKFKLTRNQVEYNSDAYVLFYKLRGSF